MNAPRLARAWRKRADEHRRRVPDIQSSPGRPPEECRVFYLCPDFDRPSGGVRMIYRHVDLLNAAGIPAWVLHARAGFACSWFAHSTAVSSVAQVVLGRHDILVVPEMYGPTLSRLPVGIRLVVNNQNAYQTFDGISRIPGVTGAPYAGLPTLEAVIVPSLDNAELLRFAFPALRVERVRCGVDTGIFKPGVAPGRRLAVMPRKRSVEVERVLHLLGARGDLDGWEVVMIDGRTEKETAELLASCAFFLSFSEAEGFGLPPAEAMAAGCYVVGYSGLAGREFFLPRFCSPVPEGDVLAFARAASGLLNEYCRSPERIRAAGLAAAGLIAANYSIEEQRADLLAFFSPLTRVRQHLP
jgi:glycosyltransferase involved in cell wall biosynthesis